MQHEEGFVIERDRLFFGLGYPIVGNKPDFHSLGTNTFFYPAAIPVTEFGKTVDGKLPLDPNELIGLVGGRILKAQRSGGHIKITDPNFEAVEKKAVQLAEHPRYSVHMWRNFISQSGHSVPYDAFVSICELAEKVKKE